MRRVRKFQREPAARTESMTPNDHAQAANEERMAVIAKRAVYLHGFEGKPYRVIAQQLKEEYSLAFVPSMPTMCRWMNLGKAELLDDIKELRSQLTIQQFNECEDLKATWFEAANRNLEVKRLRMCNGEQVEEVDEDAFAEQAKAAEVYIKLMDRQAKLLGLDLARPNDTGRDGKVDLQEIYLYVSKHITYGTAPDGSKRVKRFGDLELCLDSVEADEL